MMLLTAMSQTETATNILGFFSHLHFFVLVKLTATAAVKLVIYRGAGCLATLFECWMKGLVSKTFVRCNAVVCGT